MKQKFFVIVGVCVLLGILGFGVWWFISHRQNPIVPEVFEIPEWYYVDKDGDGITDTQETELGTSVIESDTDGDTISDKLEIEVYKTDPQNPDTDQDGYWDGLELIQGHDPLEKASIN